MPEQIQLSVGEQVLTRGIHLCSTFAFTSRASTMQSYTQGFQNSISLLAIIIKSLYSRFSYLHRNFQFRWDSNHPSLEVWPRKAACISFLGLDCPAMCNVSGLWNMQNMLILHKPMKKSHPFPWQERLMAIKAECDGLSVFNNMLE